MSKNELKYKLSITLREDHESHIYGIQIYKPYEINPEKILFATVGSNRVSAVLTCSVYEYDTVKGKVDLVDAFIDADPEESYYNCAWTTDSNNSDAILVIGGVKGIIRTIVPFKSIYKNALIGHGSSVNDLKFHPKKPFILLSASKDYTLRLWNVNTSVCIAIFCGADGHRDEVLSADFNMKATYIMSSGIDHYLKMWNLQQPKLEKAIEDSETYTQTSRSFPVVLLNFPEYSTRDIHANYVDCVKWYGDLILSKSIEDEIILWKPGLIEDSIESITRLNKNATIIHKFPITDGEIWYVRFGLDFYQKILALGNKICNIYVWDLNEDDPSKIRQTILTRPISKGLVRAVALSANGKHLIAVDDNGYIHIWNMVTHGNNNSFSNNNRSSSAFNK